MKERVDDEGANIHHLWDNGPAGLDLVNLGIRQGLADLHALKHQCNEGLIADLHLLKLEIR